MESNNSSWFARRRTYYTCLYLDENNTPGLLGMEAMKRSNTIFDLRSGEMYMYTGSSRDAQIIVPKNSGIQKLKLVESAGGHILLPCTN